ncbi:MAG TPA: PAS domain-containing protein, partial [Stellaceae bacterium]|nr:PAS domain-containing protein [Stellaceae bacterium]
MSYDSRFNRPWRVSKRCHSTGVRHITDARLDWDRIDRWTADIAAGDITAISATFTRHGAAPPGLTWNPAAELFDTESLRFLIAYWHGLAASGTLPHLKQIDPMALRPALGYVMLLDLIGGGRDFRYRVYGSIIASVSGFDMTGK